MAVGFTVIDPFRATGDPFKVALTAFLVSHVITEPWPLVMEVGLAITPAATVPPVGVLTATVTDFDVVLPEESATAIV